MPIGPLQLGLAAYALVAFVALGCLLGVVALGYWVLSDAKSRGRRSPWFDALLTVAFVPYLLLYRYWRGERTSPPTSGELAARDWTAVVFSAVLTGAMFSPPDPAMQLLWAAPVMVGGGLLVGYRHRARTGGGDDALR